MEKILKKIVDKRKKTLKEKGISFGIDLPVKRKVPLIIPDFNEGIVICEIKRGSPSEGKMNNILDPVEWSHEYIKAGANVISVLTEEDYFYGSLQDLVNIKQESPNISILRKDFLLSVDEINISFRAGADLVLLITSVLVGNDRDISLLKSMKERAEELGMLPLIEIHDQKEFEIIRHLNPKLIGINSRDLKSFKINRGYSIGLKDIIDKETNVIFESGIRNEIDSFFVGSCGFDGVLTGSSIIKSGNVAEKIKDIKVGFNNGKINKSRFYKKLFKKIYIDKKTAVKICGITNIEDAQAAIENGADVIGFIFAKSPREISIEKAKKISQSINNDVLKIGVVVDENIENAAKGVKEGWLDAIQFHSNISDEKAMSYNVCWYKAVRLSCEKDVDKEYLSPIVLYDAFSKNMYGGTGKLIDKKLLKYAKNKQINLYLAGGLNPENVRMIIEEYSPLMVDVSSGLESKPGKKDPEKIKKFFQQIKSVKINKE